jgi:hypothetical protein
MKLAKVRILSLSMLLAGLAIAVAANFLTREGSTEYTMSLILVLLLFIGGLAVAFLWGRCPNCGKHLFINFFRLSCCPHCGKPIDPNGKYQK